MRLQMSTLCMLIHVVFKCALKNQLSIFLNVRSYFVNIYVIVPNKDIEAVSIETLSRVRQFHSLYASHFQIRKAGHQTMFYMVVEPVQRKPYVAAPVRVAVPVLVASVHVHFKGFGCKRFFILGKPH